MYLLLAGLSIPRFTAFCLCFLPEVVKPWEGPVCVSSHCLSLWTGGSQQVSPWTGPYQGNTFFASCPELTSVVLFKGRVELGPSE